MKSKIVLLFIVFSSLWGVLLLRAGYLQFVPHERLNALQLRQFQTVVSLPARRGNITDINGKELAMSAPAYSIYADPKMIENKKQAAKQLARILKANVSDIMGKIRDPQKRFVWLERLISPEQVNEIKALEIKGLGFVEEWKRVYPNDYLLSSTLGFTGKEGQGLEGLELYFDKELKGETKKVSLRKDARGRPLILDGLAFTENPQGKNIKLTIDSDLQYFVETELQETIKKFDADGAYAVVLDAKTSAIRALASLPHFDANNPFKFSSYIRRNRSVTDTFEPGSTIKTVIIANAIDEKIYQPNSKIFCENGHFKIGKRVIHEAERDHGHGTISVAEILAYSSNIGTSKIALKMGDQKLREALLKFGFGQKIGVDLPGEAKGIILGLPWADHLLANISFGQGMTATPLQMANAYAVIANGGYLNQPYIVEEIEDSENSEVKKPHENFKPNRVISEETAQQMRMMLAGVTSGKGTGLNARVSGYIIGGKTGTAQKVNPNGRGYLKGGYIGSFTGFIPANDPQFVIYVAVDHPKKNSYYGAQVAAPVFASIASYAVRKNGVAPEVIADRDVSKVPLSQNEIKNEKTVTTLATSANEVYKNTEQNSEVELKANESTSEMLVPDYKNLTLREVIQKSQQDKIKIKLIGTGRVESTIPSTGAELNEDRSMTIILK